MSFSLWIFAAFFAAYGFLTMTIGLHGLRRAARSEIALPRPM